jgi:hypothetical protein
MTIVDVVGAVLTETVKVDDVLPSKELDPR